MLAAGAMKVGRLESRGSGYVVSGFEKDGINNGIRNVDLALGCGNARLLPDLFGKDLAVERLGRSSPQLAV